MDSGSYEIHLLCFIAIDTNNGHSSLDEIRADKGVK